MSVDAQEEIKEYTQKHIDIAADALQDILDSSDATIKELGEVEGNRLLSQRNLGVVLSLLEAFLHVSDAVIVPEKRNEWYTGIIAVFNEQLEQSKEENALIPVGAPLV